MISESFWRSMVLGAGLSAGLILSACSTGAAIEAAPSQAAEASVHAESGLEIVPLTISGQNAVHDFRVEVAASADEQRQGLMFRTQMGADEGMIFPFARTRMASFWMRNTVIPLDIIFIAPDGTILNIAENTTPYSEESIPSVGPAAAVLELNGGRTAELGIVAGDLVEW